MSIECNMESYMIFTAASKFCRPVAQTELLITERSFFQVWKMQHCKLHRSYNNVGTLGKFGLDKL